MLNNGMTKETAEQSAREAEEKLQSFQEDPVFIAVRDGGSPDLPPTGPQLMALNPKLNQYLELLEAAQKNFSTLLESYEEQIQQIEDTISPFDFDALEPGEQAKYRQIQDSWDIASKQKEALEASIQGVTGFKSNLDSMMRQIAAKQQSDQRGKLEQEANRADLASLLEKGVMGRRNAIGHGSDSTSTDSEFSQDWSSSADANAELGQVAPAEAQLKKPQPGRLDMSKFKGGAVEQFIRGKTAKKDEDGPPPAEQHSGLGATVIGGRDDPPREEQNSGQTSTVSGGLDLPPPPSSDFEFSVPNPTTPVLAQLDERQKQQRIAVLQKEIDINRSHLADVMVGDPRRDLIEHNIRQIERKIEAVQKDQPEPFPEPFKPKSSAYQAYKAETALIEDEQSPPVVEEDTQALLDSEIADIHQTLQGIGEIEDEEEQKRQAQALLDSNKLLQAANKAPLSNLKGKLKEEIELALKDSAQSKSYWDHLAEALNHKPTDDPGENLAIIIAKLFAAFTAAVEYAHGQRLAKKERQDEGLGTTDTIRDDDETLRAEPSRRSLDEWVDSSSAEFVVSGSQETDRDSLDQFMVDIAATNSGENHSHVQTLAQQYRSHLDEVDALLLELRLAEIDQQINKRQAALSHVDSDFAGQPQAVIEHQKRLLAHEIGELENLKSSVEQGIDEPERVPFGLLTGDERRWIPKDVSVRDQDSSSLSIFMERDGIIYLPYNGPEDLKPLVPILEPSAPPLNPNPSDTADLLDQLLDELSVFSDPGSFAPLQSPQQAADSAHLEVLAVPPVSTQRDTAELQGGEPDEVDLTASMATLFTTEGGGEDPGLDVLFTTDNGAPQSTLLFQARGGEETPRHAYDESAIVRAVRFNSDPEPGSYENALYDVYQNIYGADQFYDALAETIERTADNFKESMFDGKIKDTHFERCKMLANQMEFARQGAVTSLAQLQQQTPPAHEDEIKSAEAKVATAEKLRDLFRSLTVLSDNRMRYSKQNFNEQLVQIQDVMQKNGIEEDSIRGILQAVHDSEVDQVFKGRKKLQTRWGGSTEFDATHSEHKQKDKFSGRFHVGNNGSQVVVNYALDRGRLLGKKHNAVTDLVKQTHASVLIAINEHNKGSQENPINIQYGTDKKGRTIQQPEMALALLLEFKQRAVMDERSFWVKGKDGNLIEITPNLELSPAESKLLTDYALTRSGKDGKRPSKTFGGEIYLKDVPKEAFQSQSREPVAKGLQQFLNKSLENRLETRHGNMQEAAEALQKPRAKKAFSH